MGTGSTLAAVRAALSGEFRVDLVRHPIALALDGDVLTVEGEVEDVAAKKLALERVAAVPGVRHVVDRLRVAPARRMTDAEIRDHLRDALAGEPAFGGLAARVEAGSPGWGEAGAGAAPRVDATVSDGVVTLAGEVPSLAHRRLAGLLAWWVPGTRDVVNGLEVAPPEADSDDEVTDAVRLALEKDPLVDAAEIGVTTRGGVVRLGGTAPSQAQRRAAERDAWCVLGVDGVVNDIAVRPLDRAGR
jgi:osmotically-inducible protein OsmY